MIELGKFTEGLLAKLLEDHPDREAIEGISKIARGWVSRGGREAPALLTPELVEVTQFIPEAREALEKEGFVIYTLTGQSIRSLREAGRQFRSTWDHGHEIEQKTSILSEVAINPDPEKFFLPKSNDKPLDEQEEMVIAFSRNLTKRIPGVQAIIGEAPDYVELAHLHLDKTSERLFGGKYDYHYTRTKTPTVGSFVAYVGDFVPSKGLEVSEWDRGDGHGVLWVAPLVVPA